MTDNLALDQIRDGGAQMRVEMTESIIEEYAEAMVAGDVFPPIIVFFDETDHWLADGFHRSGAAKMLGRESIDADVRHGNTSEMRVKAAEPGGDPEEPPLFDSKRNYFTQIDHYHDWQRRFGGAES